MAVLKLFFLSPCEAIQDSPECMLVAGMAGSGKTTGGIVSPPKRWPSPQLWWAHATTSILYTEAAARPRGSCTRLA
ncbi:uncharacterized protein DMAD_00344 [Drosophila madeirensis]|uniref:Uncharacterized protein n=1 Tax=Drosophila madeirensis TaxID=30013 RepID=A0AAU9FVY1_DROMD